MTTPVPRASRLASLVLLLCLMRTGGALVQPTGPRLWVHCSSSHQSRRVRRPTDKKLSAIMAQPMPTAHTLRLLPLPLCTQLLIMGRGRRSCVITANEQPDADLVSAWMGA